MTTFASDENAIHVPVHPVRFVTATSLFDGHDASINIMRRILQSQGAEVIHLGHNRSVDEVVTAAIHEDVQGIAISSYQGGHVEYFAYLVERLRAEGLGHVKVYGGGGGVSTIETVATVVEWDALLETVWASFAAGVGVTFAFSVSIYGTVRFVELRRDERPLAAGLAVTLAVLGLCVSVAAIALGVVEMTRK